MMTPAKSSPNESNEGAGGSAGGQGWLNRNVFGVGLTSFLADLGYETATTILPMFMDALKMPVVALGAIEGLSDAVSSSIKLFSGWWSDRLGHRKAFVVMGYTLTGIMTALFAVAHSWILILFSRLLGWTGKGIRGPLRNAILAESVPPQHRGKAFGFHRAGDTLGAVLGPVMGLALLAYLGEHLLFDLPAACRTIFWLAVIPGIGSAIVFAVLVKEAASQSPTQKKLWTTVRELPANFRRFLVGVGVFGMGDFSHTLLILAAVQFLTPDNATDAQRLEAAQSAAFLYVIRNIVYCASAYPVGALSDRIGRRGLLLAGYIFAGLVMLGFAVLFLANVKSLLWLSILFALAGIFIAVEEALEGAMTADLVPDLQVRGTAYGLLGLVNGVGDFFSSVLVALLWQIAPAIGFGHELGFAFAGLVMLSGAVVLFRVR